MLNGDPPKNFDMLTHTSKGETLWLNVTVLYPSAAAEPFIAHIFRDVTIERRAALALRRFLEDLSPHNKILKGTSEDKPVSAGMAASRRSPPDKSPELLSGREIEVLTLLAEGLSTKGLAQKLNISHFTARNHIQNILVKLGLHSKAQAVSYAFKKGIL